MHIMIIVRFLLLFCYITCENPQKTLHYLSTSTSTHQNATSEMNPQGHLIALKTDCAQPLWKHQTEEMTLYDKKMDHLKSAC